MAILTKEQLLALRESNIYPNDNQEITAASLAEFQDAFINSVYNEIDTTVAGVSQPYVDGSLGVRDLRLDNIDSSILYLDTSLAWLYDNQPEGTASIDYVDGSLAQRDTRLDSHDASIDELRDYNVIQDGSIQALDASVDYLYELDIEVSKPYVDGSLAQRDERLDSLDASVDDLNDYNDTQDASIDDLYDYNDTQDASIDELYDTVANTDYVDGSLAIRDTRLDNHDASIDELRNYNVIQDASIDELRDRDEPDVFKDYVDGSLAARDERLDSLDASVDELRDYNVTQDASIDNINTDISDIEDDLDVIDASIQSLEDHNISQDASIDNINTDISDIEDKNITQDASIDDLRDYNDTQDGSIALKADKTYVDSSLNQKLNKTTDTFEGVLTVDGSLYLVGDFYQDGSTYIISAEEIRTKDNYIILREDAVTAIAPGELSGLEVTKADGTNDVVLGVGDDAIMRVGWKDDILQALATREDNPGDQYFTYWDDASAILKTFDLRSYIDGSLGNRDTLIDIHDASIGDLLDKITASDASIVLIKSDISDIEDDINDIQGHNTSQDASIEGLRDDISDIEDDLDVIDASIQSLEDHNDTQDASIDELRDNLGATELVGLADVSIDTPQDKEMLIYDASINKFVSILTEDGDFVYSTLDYVDGSLATRDTRLDDIDSSIDDLYVNVENTDYIDGSLAARDERLDSLDASVDGINSDISDIEDDLDVIDASIQSLEDHNDTQDASIQELMDRDEPDVFKDYVDGSLAQRDERLDEHDASVDELRDYNVTQDASIDNINTDISDIQDHNISQDASINELRDYNVTQDASIQELMDRDEPDVFKDYVDGSLATRDLRLDDHDSSIDELYDNVANTDYVDGSLATRDASIDDLYDTKQDNIIDGTYVKEASLGDDFVWNEGVLDVSIEAQAGALNLTELDDVSIVTPGENQLLGYDDENNYWKNVAPIDETLYEVVDASEYFWVFKDVSITDPLENQPLVYSSEHDLFLNKTIDGDAYDVVDASLYLQEKLEKETKSADSEGEPGDWSYDDDYLYVCTSTNTWGRVALEFNWV